jgi:hypothetical protein
MSISQRQIRDIRFDAVSDANLGGRKGEVCFVVVNETHYDFIEDGGSLVVDDEIFLSTGQGGNTRWVAKSGKFAKTFLREGTITPERKGELKIESDGVYIAVEV